MTLKVCESMASSSRTGVDLPEIVSGKKKTPDMHLCFFWKRGQSAGLSWAPPSDLL